MNKERANLICKVYGDTRPQLALLEIHWGNTIPINNNHKSIFNLITKELLYHNPKYEDLKSSIHHLKCEACSNINIIIISG